MRILVFLVGVALSLVSTSVRADPPKHGLRAFVSEVLRNNPSLRARALARAAVQREASGAGLWPDPEASIMLDRVPERMDGEMPMLRYQLTQMLPFPGKLGLMEEALNWRGDAAQADANTRRLELILEAKRAYWMLLANRGSREINVAGRSLLTTIANAALARYGAGAGQHHEVTRAEVERDALDVEALDLAGERVAMVAMMNALRNRPADTPIADPEEPLDEAGLQVPPLKALSAFARARRPELARMRAMQREEESMARLARRERYPDFMASVWYNQMLGGEDTGGAMLGATIPLFNVTRQNRLAEAADLRAGSAGNERAAMVSMIHFEVADALRRVVTTTRTLELIANGARPRARDSFMSSLSGYSAGAVDIVGVLQAWRALQGLEAARIQTFKARLMALADLERSI
ncbi:MAG TPA: TolC family protein, partial [Polyangiaceae bacterium]